MKITNDEQATLNIFLEFGFDSPATIILPLDEYMATGKDFYEKMSKDALSFFVKTFEDKGWNIENLNILGLNYFFRPYGADKVKVSIYEIRFTLDITPTEIAEPIEFELNTPITIKYEDLATAGTGTIITLGILLGIAIFGWLTAKEFKYMVEDVIKSPYGEGFFKTVDWGLGFGIAAIVAVVVIYVVGLIKGD